MIVTESLAMARSLFYSGKKRTVWLINFGLYSVVKRLLDLIFATLGLILLSPAFLIVAILIKKEDGGSVFFKQVRSGQFGHEFKIIKFRSMREGNNVLDNSCEDQHTKIGNFIRKTSLDEIPQLINVIKGDMSFIGPRPWITEYWNSMNEHQRIRTLVRPGITGNAQANGRNGISIIDKINYDIDYVKKFSIIMDIIVIFKTVKTVLSESDADAGKQVIHDELDELRTKNGLKPINA